MSNCVQVGSLADANFFDHFTFTVERGSERLAASFRADLSFVWRCIEPAERAAIAAGWARAGGIAIRLVPAPVISPGSGTRVNGCVTPSRDGGLELLISSDCARTVGHISVLAHELAHAAGAETELDAWGVAHRWLRGTGMPAKHALDAFLKAGGREMELTPAHAQRWGFGVEGSGVSRA